MFNTHHSGLLWGVIGSYKNFHIILTVWRNFHWVLFLLFQGLLMKTYSRVYFSLCLILVILVRSRTQRKLNPRENFPIYGICMIRQTFGQWTMIQSVAMLWMRQKTYNMSFVFLDKLLVYAHVYQYLYGRLTHCIPTVLVTGKLSFL